MVVAITSADASLQSGIGWPVLSMRVGHRASWWKAGVVEPDEVPHLVRQRVLKIVHLGAAAGRIRDQITPLEVKRVDLDVGVRDVAGGHARRHVVSASAAGS